MKLRISTASIKPNVAPSLKRLFAYIIDWYLVSMMTLVPINLIYSLTFQQINYRNSILELPLPQAALAFGIGFFLAFLYLIYYPYRSNGQTLGKKLFRLRIVKQGECALRFSTLLLRNGVGILLIEGAFFTCSGYLWELIELTSFASIATMLLPVVSIVSGASVLLSLFHPEHKMIHDYVSHTYVILQPAA